MLKHLLPVLVRAGLCVLAVLLLISAWSNREFITVLPFLVQTIVDVLLATVLAYSAYTIAQHPKRARAVTAMAGLYVVGLGVFSLWYYTYELGAAYIAQSYGSYQQFLLTQGALDVGVPVVVLGLLWWGVYTHTK